MSSNTSRTLHNINPARRADAEMNAAEYHICVEPLNEYSAAYEQTVTIIEITIARWRKVDVNILVPRTTIAAAK
jgi:hypothetical protein